MKRRDSPPDTEEVSVARNANFHRLWGAQILSQIAQNLLNFALIIRVFELAQGTRLANVSVALLILSFGIPSIFFAAAAGVYVDHWNKKLVMLTANILRGVLVLGYLFFEQNLLVVLLLSFLISAITQFFVPAEASALPKLVTRKQMLRANSLFVFTLYASFIVGYSASAPVIGLFGPSGPYYVTSIMFLLAAVLAFFLPAMQPTKGEHVPLWQIVGDTGRDLRRNWQLIRSNHGLSFPILQLTITQATLVVILALAPAMSLALLGVPIQDSSHVLIIPAGIGMVVGVAAVGRLVKRYSKRRVISTGLIVGGVLLILLGLTGQLHRLHEYTALASSGQIHIVVALIVLVLGFVNAVVSASAQTLLQENTVDATRGKVFGALNMMINIAATLPIFVVGILADLIGVTQVIAAIGAIVLVYALTQYDFLHHRRQLS